MSTKKIIIISAFFILFGFFLSGYVFAGDNQERVGGTDLDKVLAEQKILLEKINKLESALAGKENPTPETTVTPEEEKKEPEKEPEPAASNVLVAYVKEEYNSVNARADAGTTFPIVEKISPKSPMVVLETKNDWYRVKLESGNIAWVAAWVVRVQEE